MRLAAWNDIWDGCWPGLGVNWKPRLQHKLFMGSFPGKHLLSFKNTSRQPARFRKKDLNTLSLWGSQHSNLKWNFCDFFSQLRCENVTLFYKFEFYLYSKLTFHYIANIRLQIVWKPGNHHPLGLSSFDLLYTIMRRMTFRQAPKTVKQAFLIWVALSCEAVWFWMSFIFGAGWAWNCEHVTATVPTITACRGNCSHPAQYYRCAHEPVQWNSTSWSFASR